MQKNGKYPSKKALCQVLYSFKELLHSVFCLQCEKSAIDWTKFTANLRYLPFLQGLSAFADDAFSFFWENKGYTSAKQKFFSLIGPLKWTFKIGISYRQHLKSRRRISGFWFFWLYLQVVLVLELFNTSTTVDELLLSCKERMTCWANVKSHFFFYGFRNKRITTCASYFTFLIIRMDSFLHASYLFPAQAMPVHNLSVSTTAFILYHTCLQDTSNFWRKFLWNLLQKW